MTLAEHRRALGITQGAAAEQLGLKSKGFFSRLESLEQPPSLELALRIQAWSGGEVQAAELRPDLADLIADAARTAALPTEAAA